MIHQSQSLRNCAYRIFTSALLANINQGFSCNIPAFKYRNVRFGFLKNDQRIRKVTAVEIPAKIWTLRSR